MCDVCGCGDTKIVPVEIQENLMVANDTTAAHNREHLRRRGQCAINLMGSPGAGKTAVLEATARALAARAADATARGTAGSATAGFGAAATSGAGAPRLAALTGDLETDNDARRLEAVGVRAVPITTGTACHLDADMVHHALHAMGGGGEHSHHHSHDHGHSHGHHHHHEHDAAALPAEADWLFIENVGNLVCPAIYDLGQEANVVAISVTEGEDKPLKYPVMFRKADLVLITKIDLLPALPDFDRAALEDALARVMPRPRVIAVSARTGEGIDEWISWMQGLRATRLEGAGDQAPAKPHEPPGARASGATLAM